MLEPGSSPSAIAGFGLVFLALATPIAGLFAWLVGVREYWAFSVERDLRREAQRSQNDLATSRQQLSAVLESTTDSVVVIDRDAKIVFFNKRAAEMAVFSSPPVIGKPVADLFEPTIAAGMQDRFSRSFATGAASISSNTSASPQCGSTSTPFPRRRACRSSSAISPRSIASAKRSRTRSSRSPDRSRQPAYGPRRTTPANRCGRAAAVLFIDLDHFKEVNDTLGHPVGDILLHHVAGRLRKCVRESDMVGRLGGDEFAVVQLGIMAGSESAALARRILAALSVTLSTTRYYT